MAFGVKKIAKSISEEKFNGRLTKQLVSFYCFVTHTKKSKIKISLVVKLFWFFFLQVVLFFLFPSMLSPYFFYYLFLFYSQNAIVRTESVVAGF